MSRGERGQVTIAGVWIGIAVLMGMLVLAHLASIRAGAARGQSAADVAALAGVRVLAANPEASPNAVKAAVAEVAAANGARVESVRIESAGGVPKAVDVTVSERVTGNVPGVGRRVDRVLSWSRAGVTYSATLVQTAFRPVDIGGARGAAAVVAAAEAQIGWPYVWGGESRAEGGFDCSGLIDYAYGAAGTALPGRPTAAGLWQMSEHISEAELAPGDLVFLGAPSNAPYHVGMYVGGGMTVVAPHTGAVVSYEPLAANPWDGFGRLLKGPPASDPVESRVEAAARRYGVPPNVVSAELQHWPDRDPDRVAAALARSMRAHDHDLMSALTEQLGGDASAAAVIIRTASGPALGSGFSATIELLPRQHPRSSSDLPPLAGPGRGSIISNLAGTLTNGVEWVGDLRHGKGLRLPEHLGHGWNLGLDMFGIVPGIVGAVAQVASAARDIYNVVSDLMVVREVAQTAGRWARVLRFANIAIWLLQALMGGYAAYRARSWRGRIYNGVMCAAGIAGVVAATAGGPELLAGAVVVTGAATVWANWDTIEARVRRGVAAARTSAGTMKQVATRVRGALHGLSRGFKRIVFNWG